MNNHPASLVTLLSPGGHTEPADGPLAAAALHEETGAPGRGTVAR
ncbi:hypothetical protein [Streptomyces acidiscabies]|nr:hypothetical protein [Streptomyces acidiscabies]